MPSNQQPRPPTSKALTRSRNQLKRNTVPKTFTSQALRVAGFPRFNHNDIFPPMTRKQFNFSRYFTIIGSTNVGDIGNPKQFLLNGLYDVAADGSSPYGYANYLSANGPYKRYKVVGVKIKVTAVAPNPCYLVTQLRNVIDTYSISGDNMNDAAEKPGVRMDYIPATGSQSKSFVINLPTLAPLFNWDNNTFNIDMGQTTGPYNNLPGSSPYLLLGACYPTVASRSLDCNVEIMLDTVLYDRETL